jgi:hypothetical protein
MNARILELIKNPEVIQNQDLDLLNSEVNKHPYLQNIRALHLIATHQFNIENYQKELSLTAAYTTDKKILYQLINKKTEDVSVKENTAEPVIEIQKIKAESSSVFEEIKIEPKPTAQPVLVEGVLNRILFEGEEDFLERETAKIDLESTFESGQIVTRKIIKEENSNSEKEFSEVTKTIDYQIIISEKIIDKTEIRKQEEVTENTSEVSFPETQEFLPEVQINANKTDPHQKTIVKSIDNEDGKNSKDTSEIKDYVNQSPEIIIIETEVEQKEMIENPSEISFHGSEEFLPDVKIKSNSSESKSYKPPQSKLSKQEEEMRQLIAAVEAKMKASKKEITKETEVAENSDVNFSRAQEFNIEGSNKVEIAIQIPEKEIEIEKEVSSKTEEIKEIQPVFENPTWKPMQLSIPTPNALIEKKVEIKTENLISKEKITESITNQKSEERPVFNVSFFTPQVSSIETKKEEAIAPEFESEEKNKDVNAESNIPVFINTWQNWLKIERKEEVSEQKHLISKEEVKNNVIEKFIEKEPKISKLKEESDFIVKEKSTNISHLMTETLANLYLEQKLYAKAIKAYEVLIGKHPQKEERFNEKIQEIKDLRKNI